MKRLALLALTLVIPSCVFFEDDDDDVCAYYEGGRGDQGIAREQRDPVTGVCQAYNYGYDCADPCQPCAGAPEVAIAYPDWGFCDTQCEALDEGTCKSTSGCRAVYAGNAFHECWSTSQSGPIQGGGCVGLDAYSCSQHDDCVAIHDPGAPIGSFASCANETTSGDPGSCVGEVLCDALPPACPMGTIPGRTNSCWTGYCIPYAQCDQLPACNVLDEMSCIDRDDCAPIYEGQNCSCNGASCTCQSWTFETCQAN